MRSIGCFWKPWGERKALDGPDRAVECRPDPVRTRSPVAVSVPARPHIPSFARLLAKQGPAGPLIEQRSREVLREGNLWEAARTLARQLFKAALPEKGLALRPPPMVEVQGGWWRRRRWEGRIVRCGSWPTPGAASASRPDVSRP